MVASLCKQFHEDGVVCPISLRKSLFTVGAIDNIDHNLTSMSASSSFHGTGISLFQNPTVSRRGEERPQVSLPTDGNRNHRLPDSYAVVPAVELKKSSTKLPPCPVITSQTNENDLKLAVEKEDQWISHALSAINHEASVPLTWSAYHASSMSSEFALPAVCTMLPLFYEKAASSRNGGREQFVSADPPPR